MGKGRGRVTVEDLPEECLALVFSFLPSNDDRDAAALTCRRWRAIRTRSSHTLRCNLWRLTADQASQFPHRILSILRSFPHLRHIFINGYMEEPELFCAAFRNRDFAQLQSLHLTSAIGNITEKGLVSMAVGCPALLHCTLHSAFISDAGLHVLVQSCPLLMSLDVSYCDRITDSGIDEALASCHNMNKLSCSNIKGWGLRHGKKLQELEVWSCRMGVADLTQGIQGMVSLQALGLRGLKGCHQVLIRIAECCKLLKVIDVSMCTILDNFAVKKIAQGCPDLRVWEMSSCHRVSSDGWEALALSAVKLEELNVSRCKRFCLADLVILYSGCPSLRKLKLSSDYLVWHLAIKDFRVSRPDIKVEECVRGPAIHRD